MYIFYYTKRHTYFHRRLPLPCAFNLIYKGKKNKKKIVKELFCGKILLATISKKWHIRKRIISKG